MPEVKQRLLLHPLTDSAKEGAYGDSKTNRLLVRIITESNLIQIMPFRDMGLKVGDSIGLPLPNARNSVSAVDIQLFWNTQNSWYLQIAANNNRFNIKDFQNILTGIASVTDQSAAFAVLQISGMQIESVLSKGCSLDFHESVFPIGSCATSILANAKIHIRRLSVDAYQLLVPRSFASQFWQWFQKSAIEFGYDVEITP